MYKILLIALSILLLSLALLPFVLHVEPSSDTDGFLVWLRSRTMHDYGKYEVSRFPGFPAFELLAAIFRNYRVFNAVLALIWIAGIFVIARCARKIHGNPLITAYLWALLPTNFAMAASAMDYTLGNFFLALGLFSYMNRKNFAAWLFFGTAVATRITNIIIPTVILIFPPIKSEKNLKANCSLGCALAFMLPIIAFYSFPFIRYGFSFIRAYPVEFSLLERLKWFLYRGGQFLGFLPTIFIILFIPFCKVRLDRLFIFSIICAALYLVVFFIAPLEPAYLLPIAIPAVLALSKIPHKKALVIMAILFLGGFLDVYPINPDYGDKLRPTVMPGGYLNELRRRNEITQMRIALDGFSAQTPFVFVVDRGAALLEWNGKYTHAPWVLDFEDMMMRKPGEYFAPYPSKQMIERAILEKYNVYTFEKIWHRLKDERIQKVPL